MGDFEDLTNRQQYITSIVSIIVGLLYVFGWLYIITHINTYKDVWFLIAITTLIPVIYAQMKSCTIYFSDNKQRR